MNMLLSQAAAGTVTALFLLAIKKLFSAKLSRRWHFYIWAILAVRLMIPIFPESGISIYNALPHVAARQLSESPVMPASSAYQPGAQGVGKPPAAGDDFMPARQTESPVLLIWGCGAGALFLFFTASYLVFQSKCRNLPEQNDTKTMESLWEAKTLTGVGKKITVRTGGSTPILKGILRQEILLPDGYTREEMTRVFVHELMHAKHFDVPLSILYTFLLCMNWYNPILWYCFFVIRQDMELLCDERVLEVLGDRKEYAKILLKTALRGGGFVFATTSLHNGERGISRRIKFIAGFKKPKRLWSVIAVAAALVVAAVCLTSAQGAVKQKEPTSGYDAAALYKTRTDYIGDASKVGTLTRLLPLSEYGKGIQLHTKNPPYGLTVNYALTSEEFMEVRENSTKLYQNASILFALIKNVDTIHFAFELGDAIYTYTFERGVLSGVFGQDFRDSAASLAEFRDELVPRILSFTWPPLSLSEVTSYPTEDTKAETSSAIEEKLAIILSSPLTSSAIQPYIDAHQTEYQDILKMGEPALEHLLSEFADGHAEGLKGQIMLSLCKELLGDRNNVPEGSYKTPEEWFKKLSPYTAAELQPFVPRPADEAEALVYQAAYAKYRGNASMTIIVPHVFGTYDKGDTLRIFSTVFYSSFNLYGKTLSQEGGGIVPAAIDFQKNADGTYTFQSYTEAKDGAYFKSSIEEFCQPKSDIAKEILKEYGDHSELIKRMKENARLCLQQNHLTGISLKEADGALTPLT